jgi:hypothetical protein
MYRYLLTITLVLVLWVSSAEASIGRTQGFDIGALNRVVWEGGIGSARGEIQAGFSQSQQFSDRLSSVSVVQVGRGSLTQSASASGGGFGTARNSATIGGTQDLLAETTRPFAHRAQQDLGARLDTRLFKPNGIGAVNGGQSYSGAQEQSVVTPYSVSSQSQSMDVRQSGAIVTEVDMDPTVRNIVTVNLRQAQSVTGP